MTTAKTLTKVATAKISQRTKSGVVATTTHLTPDTEESIDDCCDRAFLKAFARSARRKNANAVDLFGHICDHHRGKFNLARVTLFFVTGSSKQLKSFALWDQGQIRSGVMVQIPREQSAFYELLDTQCSKTFAPAACFNGSPIEEKLTVSNSSGALYLAPLYNDGAAVGMIAFNSNERRPFAGELDVLQQALSAFGSAFDSAEFFSGAR